MFLETIHVENIRSLSDTLIDFVDPNADRPSVRQWTLLVGENGTGKSTLLKAIGLVVAGSDCTQPLIGQKPGAWVRHGAPFGRITARLRTAEWEPRDIALEIHAGDSPRELLSRNAETLRALDDAISHATQNYFVAAYGPYRRVSDDGLLISGGSSRLPPRALSLQTLFDKNALVHPLPAWAMTLEYQRGEEGLDIVRDAMNALMPGVAFIGVDKEAGTLRFETADGVVTLDQLSDGFQNVAAWIGDLLFRVTEAFAHRRHPLDARGLLLIDEIDAHLHPAWQRRLRQFLSAKLPNFQIIASTHSALTLQQAHEGEAVILARDAHRRVRAETFPGDPSKLRLHQLYDLAFKIESLDSWEIEQSKNAYRALSEKQSHADLSDAEQNELAEVRAVLELLPDDRDDSLGNEALNRYFSSIDKAAEALSAKTSEA